MRILAIAHEKNLNGASLSMLDIIIWLKKNNHVVMFVPYENGSVIEYAKAMGIDVICRSYNKWMIQTKTRLSYLKQKLFWIIKTSNENESIACQIAEYVQNERIDMIYTNTRVMDLGIRLKRMTGAYHIWHIREFGEEDFNYKVLDGTSKHWRLICKYTDGIIANSNAVAQKIKTKTKDTVPVVTIYNGLDGKYIYNREFKKPKIINFLITGRIVEAKGHDILLKAIKILINKGITNFAVYVAGSGDLHKLCGDLYDEEIRKYCIQLGQVDNIWEIRKKMDVELMCSRSEAFGRVTVEAMLSEMLVIGANTGGTVEIISDGETGLLFKSGDPLDLACQMEKVIKVPELISLIAPKAKYEAMKRFSKERYCKEVEEFLNKRYFHTTRS